MKLQFKTLAISLSLGLMLSACADDGAKSAGTISTPTTTTPNTGSSTTENINKVVTVGAGINFNSQTGSWSDLAIDPVLKTPGVVYYDRSAQISSTVGITGALKYAKMSAYGAWDIEYIDVNSPMSATSTACAGGATSAACIGAPNVAIPANAQPQIYGIGFLNYTVNAQPVVAYAYGTGFTGSSTSGKVIRVATRTSTGWNIETAVSGAQILGLTGGNGPILTGTDYPIRGIRVLVDDSNRVHVYFGVYSSTITSSVYAYVMKKTDGTWTNPVAITTAAPSVLTFAAAASAIGTAGGMTQAGAAWCKYTGGGSSTNGVNAILSIGAMDNTPSPSTQGFLLRCSAANADGDCSTWQGLEMVAGCTGPAACITTAPVTAAATINHFGRSDIAINPNDGRIILNYFQAAPNLTAPVGAGVVTARSPLACDAGLTNALWGTARYLPGVAQGTMGMKAATDGTDIVMASAIAPTGTSMVVNKILANLSVNWNATPDQAPIDATTGVYIGGGMAYDSSTQVFWGSIGSLTASAVNALGQDLKVFSLYSGDVVLTGPPITQYFVDQTNTVAQPVAVPMLDAAKAPNGTVGYAYFYQEPSATVQGVNSHIYYGTRGGTAIAPTFGEKIVASSINGAGTIVGGVHPSLAYDSQSNPVIAFLDQGVAASSGILTVARSTNAGVTFSIERVDGAFAAATNNVGQYSSVDMSSSDTTGISYYDYSTGGTGQRLKFAKRLKNGSWRRYIVDGPGSGNANGCTTVGASTTGMYSRLKWTSTGRPVIVYQSQVAGIRSLKLAFATEAESSATYTWNCLTIDTTSQGGNARGEGIDFVLSSADLPYIAHYDSGLNTLRVVNCASSVLSCGASAYVGEKLIYLIGTAQTNASRPGIEVTSTGKIFVSYHGQADQGLFYTTKENGVWSAAPTLVEGSPANSNASLTGTHGILMLNSNNQPMMFYRSYENWIRYFSKETY